MSKIQNRMGSIAYSIIGVRHATLKNFFQDFNIDFFSYCYNTPKINEEYSFKELLLYPNFVFFLIENKTFIQFYETDYYQDKSIQIIANKIEAQEDVIRDYFNSVKYKVDEKYPYRYISSYAIDFKLNQDSYKYKCLKYDDNHRYEGNFEFRRANYSN